MDQTVVAIIGGGFTGATVAVHVARGLQEPARIVVIEPRDRLGAGLAYSTEDPSHRINVPASRMTMDTALSDGFQQWIAQRKPDLSPGTDVGGGVLFPQRGLIADYLADALAPHLASGVVTHLRGRAVSGRRDGGRFQITLQDGSTVQADLLVIATSHPPPGVPAAFAGLSGSARLIADSSVDPQALTRLANVARNILVVGTGLTSADVIASLDRQGYRGQITALSRRGLRSRGHVFGHAESPADFTTDPAVTALGVLRRVRAAVRRDAAAGLPWQATLDRVRKDGPAIWAALPQAQRARLVDKLRVWWDVHRFRIAPQVEAVLDRLVAKGRLQIAVGNLLAASEQTDGIAIDWRPRGQAPRRDRYDAVILTTGPAHGGILRNSPLLGAMALQGLVRPDPLHLGLEVTDGCRAVGTDGQTVPRLLVAGPLARGHVGELMGIPEVTAHAQSVAARILDHLHGASALD